MRNTNVDDTSSTSTLRFVLTRIFPPRLTGRFDRPALPVVVQGGCVGQLESAFGKAGRFKARFPAGSSIKVR